MTDPLDPYFGDGMPAPALSDDTAPFWHACNEHRLIVQQCAACGQHRFPPRPVCWNCQSFACRWTESAGRGLVFTYTIAHHSPHPVAVDRTPYNIAIIQLDDCDGCLVISNVVDCADDALRIGLAVEVCWEDRVDGQSLYRFRPAPG